jgi:hypothetical protein
VVPEPVVVIPPGVVVMVHVPVAGSPLKAMLPVDTEQVGCVTVPITGAVGAPGTAFIVADVEADDVQGTEFETVNV